MSEADAAAGVSPLSNDDITQKAETLYRCVDEIEQSVMMSGFEADDLMLPIEQKKLDELGAVVREVAENSHFCKLLYQEDTEAIVVTQAREDRVLEGIHYLVRNRLQSEASWLGYLAKNMFNVVYFSADQYLQYSSLASLAVGTYRYLDAYYRETGVWKEKANTQASVNGSILNCFFEGRREQCQSPAVVSYVLSAASVAFVAGTGYRLLGTREIAPSNRFIVSALVGMTLTSAWWGVQYTKSLLAVVQLLRSYYLFPVRHRQLFSAGKAFSVVLTAYYLNAIISYVDNLYSSGYWTAVSDENSPLFLLSGTITLSSLFFYIKNIHLPERFLLFAGGSTSAYLVAAFAALYGTEQEVPFRYGHIAFIYGGMVVNSLIEFGGLINVMPVLTQFSIYALRHAYGLKAAIPDVLEDFDPVQYFIIAIALPSIFIFNIPIF